MKSNGVYRIVNNINKKVYIGSTGSKGGFKKRWSYHLSDLRQNKHHSRHLQRAWNKYGEDSFVFEILEIIENFTKETLLIREQYYLDFYKSYDVNLGYNICKIAGSSLGIKKTPEQIKQMSDLRKGKPIPWLNNGQPRSEDHIENLRNACIGKISEKLDKTYKEIYGEKKAIELKKKLSESHKGQFIGDKHPQAKPIAQYTKSGEYIQEFGSATTAANVLNLSAKSIRQCTNNKIKTSGGFIWKHKI
jgi:group I intron endonuclease